MNNSTTELTLQELNKVIEPYLNDPYLKWRGIECSAYTSSLFRQAFIEVSDRPGLFGGIEVYTNVNMPNGCAKLLDGKGNSIGYWITGYGIVWRS